MPTRFQSAPRPCDRGDTASRPVLRRRLRFNPRPGLATGATERHHDDRRGGCVSIRAPALRPGRLLSSTNLLFDISFQSAPRPCDRGDTADTMPMAEPMGFNPRPGLATGATTNLTLTVNGIMFQSAPRPCDRGDPFGSPPHYVNTAFQSAPRPCDRGDFNCGTTGGTVAVFQSAPRPCDRGDAGIKRELFRDSGFNPRPGLATGATFALAALAALATFQSAPRPCDRGDSSGSSGTAPACAFQSAPRPCDRGDRRWASVASFVSSFNPRPGLATGATHS